jgi:hypothetical protein
MTYRNARRGAAVGGSVLLIAPVLDVLLGSSSGSMVHMMVGALGAMLLALSGSW